MGHGLRVLALGLTLSSMLAACGRGPAFEGTALAPPRQALDFTLTDQFGQPVRLSALRGKVIALTFIYTACRDVCPLVTGKIRDVTNLLGERRAAVAFLVVTLDPGRDTVRETLAYSRRWGLAERWSFLTGSERELEPVWRYYWAAPVGPGALTPPSLATGVAHSSPVHLIDRRGRIRVVHGDDFSPSALAHDIALLLRG